MVEHFIAYSEGELGRIFDEQLAALVAAGVAAGIIRELARQREAVIAEAAGTAYPEGHLPFQPVAAVGGEFRFEFDIRLPPPACRPQLQRGVVPAAKSGSAALAVRGGTTIIAVRPAAGLPDEAIASSALGLRSAVRRYAELAGRTESVGTLVDLYA